MKIFFALAGLTFAAVSAAGVSSTTSSEKQDAIAATKRRLEDDGGLSFDDLCIICDLCDIAGDLCDSGAIADFACGLCDEDSGSDPDLGGICFSREATVQVLADNGPVTTRMAELQVGDRVLTGAHQYETVYSFGHFNPSKPAAFVQIYNQESKRPLEVSADHMVFLQNQPDPVAAETIQVGHVLQSSSRSAGSKVTKISTVHRHGVFAPLTTGGTLVVDGVVASSYIRVDKNNGANNHALVHLALAPYRTLCMGVSDRFCQKDFYNHDGMPFYVRYGLDLLFWVTSSSSGMIQAAAMAVIVSFTGFFRVLELAAGPSLAPLAVFLAALAFSTIYKKTTKAKKM